MERFSRTVYLVMVIFLMASCMPIAPTATEKIDPPTPEPAISQAFHPLDTKTGIEEIDTILEAVARGDTQMVWSLVGFTTAECTKQEGLGGPPKCREGEAEGTLVEVLPSLGSEGSFTRSDEFETWTGINVAGLYAIYQVSPAVISEQYYPAGEYAIVFAGEANRPGISLRVSDGKIVRVDYIFDTSREALNAILEREASELILAPVSQATGFPVL